MNRLVLFFSLFLVFLLFSCSTTENSFIESSIEAIDKDSTTEETLLPSLVEDNIDTEIKEEENNKERVEETLIEKEEETEAQEKKPIIEKQEEVIIESSIAKIEEIDEEIDEVIIEESLEETIAEEEEEKKTLLSLFDKSDIFSSFSYAFALRETDELIQSTISFVPSYYALGLYDAFLDYNSPRFIPLVEMQSFINEFVIAFYEEEIVVEKGEMPEYLEDITSLPLPPDRASLFSYIYGFMVMRDLMSEEIDIEIIPFIYGSLSSFYSTTRLFTQSEIEGAINNYISYLNQEYYLSLEKQNSENEDKAKEFFERNKDEEGIVVLENGVQMLIIGEDENLGNYPTQYDRVIMDYNVYLLEYETEELEIVDADYYKEVSVIELDNGIQSAITHTSVGQAVRAFIPLLLDTNYQEDNRIVVYDYALHSIL